MRTDDIGGGRLPAVDGRTRGRIFLLAAITLALSAATSGCGDDDDDDHPAATPTPTASTPTATAGPNRPPVIAPIGDRTVVLGSDLLLAVSASDPEGAPVTLSSSGLPDNAYFLPDSGIFCLFADVEAQLAAPIQVTFTASDGTAESSETITIRVVRPDAAALIALGTRELFTFAPLANQLAHAGETLMLQLSASGASPIAYRMYPEPALAPLVTLDATTGAFRFSPTAEQTGQQFEITLQACLAEGAGCSAIVQAHQTIHLTVNPPGGASCPDYVPTSGCTELQPGARPSDLPQPLRSCYVIRKAGKYTFDFVNILKDGNLYIVEDPTGTIDVRVRSMLVEMGGKLQAGSPVCPFGKQASTLGMKGGKLTIGLYGNDPSDENRTPNPTPGIECRTGCKDNPAPTPMSCSQTKCFPRSRDFVPNKYYCTKTNTDDPCFDTTVDNAPCPGFPAATPTPNIPNGCKINSLQEDYHHLNFDHTPFGYKVLGVSYGGSLKMFGYKGAKPLQNSQWGQDNDSNDHCVAPTVDKSTLDASEMQAWADLAGNSWARLNAVSADRTMITLDRNVEADPSMARVGTDWAESDQIVVGTTDWYPSHSELRSITKVATVEIGGSKYTQLTLDRALDYPHNAKIFNTDDLGVTFTGKTNRKAADLRASVGLLSRSIQIRSLGKDANTESLLDVKDCTADKTKPECYFGGHVMFRQGFQEVQVQGVEFKQLGQGGRMGHYPVHFHLAKSTAYTQGKAFVKDSSIWDSMTRFAVLHGTHGVTLARNVGYLSLGSGYFLEDGSEIENKLCHNLGVGARASLQEYFTAQAKLTPLPLTARYVPPILDGVLPVPNPDMDDPNRPVELTGSDTYMPVMFWFMNAYNELVGNNAVGVHGFGSCYWLLGSGVSGPSFSTHKFAGLANYNIAADHQAPLLRFRGNSCMTSPLALPASAELPPATSPLNTENKVGYHAVPNPYIAGKAKIRDLQGMYTRPAVNGDFKPIQPNTAGTGGSLFTNCAQVAVTGTEKDTLEHNTKSCVATVIDRFSTSYNWAEVNFGSIWFRPWFYLFLNSAMTDQLFGGLTFVTAGSWMQVPPGYFSLAKNSLFVGTSQYGPSASQYAKRSGPIFRITNSDSVGNFAPCVGPKSTCNIETEGTGYWRDFFQPKRLVTIYDGPHFADGNTFVNVGSWTCNPAPCQGMGTCNTEFECGIYSSTVQPAVTDMGRVNLKSMVVIDAAIGWKQPNGFYYPPAFAYRKSNFVKTLSDMPAGVKALNQCFSFGKEDDFKEPSQRDGSCRHNVIDRTRPYIKGNLISPNAAPQIFGPGGTAQPVTPIDFSTILLDVDGSLTGATGALSGKIVETSSVSRNPFFDAPAQSPECLSFGLQTSPYQFVTTMLAPLAASPAAGNTSVKPWMTLNCMNGYDDQTCICPPPPPPPTPNPNPHLVNSSPLVPIYRQWRFPSEPVECGPICSASHPGEYACNRGTYMIGPDVGHATYLTMAQPQALMPSAQPGALYYIDTNAGGGGMKPDISCITARTCVERPPTFAGNESYVLYDLFARNDSKISYQLYVGSGSTVGSLAGRYVHVTPHLHAAGNTFQSGVRDACDPSAGTGWCKDLPVPSVDANGVLTVVLDQSRIKDDYQITKRPDYERCMPRNFCYYDGTQCRPCTKDRPECIGQAERLQSDIDVLAHTDGNMENPLNVICQDWGGFASGTKTTTLGERSFVDCPASGCLGFAFTLPNGFTPKPYNEVGAPLSHCFDQAAWKDDALVALEKDGQLIDPLCKGPRTPVPSDFCTDPGRPTPTQTPTRMMGATPTNTATGNVAPTNTPTRASTATVTPSGGATATATATGRTSPSPTPTVTPTPSLTPSITATPATGTPTVTPTAGGSGLSWILNGSPANTVNVPHAGMGYPEGVLKLVDSQMRFCTQDGLQPILTVDVAGHPIVGVFPMNTTGEMGIANIPTAHQSGVFDLLVETRIPCQAVTPPTTLHFPGAITYGGS